MSNRLLSPFLLVIAALALAACNPIKPYRMEIQQGNFVTQDMVSRLSPGMSKEQVRLTLGTPLLTDIFHADRWDYIYRRQKVSSKDLEERRLTVFFKDNRLVQVDGDVMPARQAEAAAK